MGCAFLRTPHSDRTRSLPAPIERLLVDPLCRSLGASWLKFRSKQLPSAVVHWRCVLTLFCTKSIRVRFASASRAVLAFTFRPPPSRAFRCRSRFVGCIRPLLCASDLCSCLFVCFTKSENARAASFASFLASCLSLRCPSFAPTRRLRRAHGR